MLAHVASRTPRTPPARETSRLSVRSWRIKRPWLAPRACRTASSLARVAPLASSRFATLAHAISSTNTTAPIRTRSVDRVSPDAMVRSVMSWARHPLSSG
ncbi:MAG: hypothetical protein DMF81_25045 [Acidobacteria bacterium]|nr:MAG: hypothetical protein DMF81_25045 [Acidobacteriota bacterium]